MMSKKHFTELTADGLERELQYARIPVLKEIDQALEAYEQISNVYQKEFLQISALRRLKRDVHRNLKARQNKQEVAIEKLKELTGRLFLVNLYLEEAHCPAQCQVSFLEPTETRRLRQELAGQISPQKGSIPLGDYLADTSEIPVGETPAMNLERSLCVSPDTYGTGSTKDLQRLKFDFEACMTIVHREMEDLYLQKIALEQDKAHHENQLQQLKRELEATLHNKCGLLHKINLLALEWISQNPIPASALKHPERLPSHLKGFAALLNDLEYERIELSREMASGHFRFWLPEEETDDLMTVLDETGTELKTENVEGLWKRLRSGQAKKGLKVLGSNDFRHRILSYMGQLLYSPEGRTLIRELTSLNVGVPTPASESSSDSSPELYRPKLTPGIVNITPGIPSTYRIRMSPPNEEHGITCNTVELTAPKHMDYVSNLVQLPKQKYDEEEYLSPQPPFVSFAVGLRGALNANKGVSSAQEAMAESLRMENSLRRRMRLLRRSEHPEEKRIYDGSPIRIPDRTLLPNLESGRFIQQVPCDEEAKSIFGFIPEEEHERKRRALILYRKIQESQHPTKPHEEGASGYTPQGLKAQFSGKHQYEHFSALRELSKEELQNPKGVLYKAYTALRHHAAPGAHGIEVSEEPEGTDLPVSALGDVNSVADPASRSVTNSTRPNHFLHPGAVNRQVVIQGKTLGIRTVGIGKGAFPKMNSWLAPVVWNPVDKQIRLELSSERNQ
ncbi:hypothetical protein [Fulvitalea axinellae]